MDVQPKDVLGFWFDPAHRAHWFEKAPHFDEQIRGQFAGTVEAATRGDLDGWTSTPAGWLALLILLDQFSRNLHRGSPRAWAADVKAQRFALSGLDAGFDQALSPLERVFAYLPLEHAEDAALQRRSVALFEKLHEQAGADEQARFAGFLDYARRHRDVIARFGRFPHRNAVLGRDSSAAELEYLTQPGAGF